MLAVSRSRPPRPSPILNRAPTMAPASLILAAALVWLSSSDARAADIRNVLVDYTLTSWTQRDGLPSVIIRTIAQDKDGYLWLGTDAGPVRFDGARFTSPEAISTSPLRDQSIRSLCATRDGSVWFGLGGRGGVARFRDGQVQTYGPDDGIPPGAVTLLFEDPHDLGTQRHRPVPVHRKPLGRRQPTSARAGDRRRDQQVW